MTRRVSTASGSERGSISSTLATARGTDPCTQSQTALVTAAIQVKRFEGKRSDGIRDDIPLGEIRRYSPAHSFAELITPLSKAEFDRAIDLVDRVRHPELKLHMKLLAVQAAMAE